MKPKMRPYAVIPLLLCGALLFSACTETAPTSSVGRAGSEATDPVKNEYEYRAEVHQAETIGEGSATLADVQIYRAFRREQDDPVRQKTYTVTLGTDEAGQEIKETLTYGASQEDTRLALTLDRFLGKYSHALWDVEADMMYQLEIDPKCLRKESETEIGEKQAEQYAVQYLTRFFGESVQKTLDDPSLHREVIRSGQKQGADGNPIPQDWTVEFKVYRDGLFVAPLYRVVVDAYGRPRVLKRSHFDGIADLFSFPAIDLAAARSTAQQAAEQFCGENDLTWTAQTLENYECDYIRKEGVLIPRIVFFATAEDAQKNTKPLYLFVEITEKQA